MATVIRRKGSPYWFARFQIDGKDYTLSTKQKNRNEAMPVMRGMVQERKGTLSADGVFDTLLRQLKKLDEHADSPQRKDELNAKRQDLARLILRGQQEKIGLDDAWLAWLKSPKKRNPGSVTIRQYESEWKRFYGWADARNIQFLHELTLADAEDYATDLWESNVAPGTYNAHLNFLKSLFRVLKVRAGLASNPWAEIPTMTTERESRRMLTSKEITKVCQSATDSLRYMMGLGLYTGMRLGDVVTLRWDAIHAKQGFIEIMPGKTRRTNKKVRLPIHPVLRSLLKELRATSRGTFLFPKERSAYEDDPSSVSKSIQAFFESCGIQTTEAPTNGHRRMAIVRVGFHSLRHSFVSLCAANRVPQVAIMDLVGHGSPAMTALYSHAGDEQKAEAIAALPAFRFEDGESKKPRKSRKTKEV